MNFSQLILCAAIPLLAGCASTQLNYNALEIAGTVDDLVAAQITHNLAKFIRDANSIPSQVSIPSGSVTTTNQVGASWSDPLTRAITATRNVAVANSLFAPSQAVTQANVLTPAASNQWSQNWTLAPVTDSDQIRRLAALYRYATNPRSVDLCQDYPIIMTQGAIGANQNTSETEDDTAWRAVANGGPDNNNKIPLYRAYLENYSKHAWAATRIISHIQSGASNKTEPYESDWTEALDNDTLDQYGKYLSDHSLTDQNKPHVQAARDRIKLLLQAQTKKPVTGNQQNAITAIETPDGAITVTAGDSLFLKEPSCILCSKRANSNNISRSPGALIAMNSCKESRNSDLYVNPRLTTCWLIYSTPSGEFLQVTPDGPVPTSSEGLYNIGTSGGIALYTRDTRAYNEFILFVLEATAQGSTSGQSGKNPGRAGAASAQFPAAATIPLTTP